MSRCKLIELNMELSKQAHRAKHNKAQLFTNNVLKLDSRHHVHDNKRKQISGNTLSEPPT
jgi:hypothetical protein